MRPRFANSIGDRRSELKPPSQPLVENLAIDSGDNADAPLIQADKVTILRRGDIEIPGPGHLTFKGKQ
jgi:hypothetical protein